MNNLIILVGNIGSGKSTLCEMYQRRGYVVISRDSLRYAIGAGNYVFNPDYEWIIWDAEIQLFEDFLSQGVDIIVDSPGLSKSMRQRYIKIAKSSEYNYDIVCHNLQRLSMEESVKRRLQKNHGNTSKEKWEEIWKKFDNFYEEPTLDEGFSNIYTYL